MKKQSMYIKKRLKCKLSLKEFEKYINMNKWGDRGEASTLVPMCLGKGPV